MNQLIETNNKFNICWPECKSKSNSHEENSLRFDRFSPKLTRWLEYWSLIETRKWMTHSQAIALIHQWIINGQINRSMSQKIEESVDPLNSSWMKFIDSLWFVYFLDHFSLISSIFAIFHRFCVKFSSRWTQEWLDWNKGWRACKDRMICASQARFFEFRRAIEIATSPTHKR